MISIYLNNIFCHVHQAVEDAADGMHIMHIGTFQITVVQYLNHVFIIKLMIMFLATINVMIG